MVKKKLRIKLRIFFLQCKMWFFPAKKNHLFCKIYWAWYETPLQSSPVDCRAYSAQCDNMFIQIGPSMCSISELMGKKKQQNNNNNKLFQENLFNKVRLYSTTSSQFPTHSIHVIQLIFFVIGFIGVVVITCE